MPGVEYLEGQGPVVKRWTSVLEEIMNPYQPAKPEEGESSKSHSIKRIGFVVGPILLGLILGAPGILMLLPDLIIARQAGRYATYDAEIQVGEWAVSQQVATWLSFTVAPVLLLFGIVLIVSRLRQRKRDQRRSQDARS